MKETYFGFQQSDLWRIEAVASACGGARPSLKPISLLPGCKIKALRAKTNTYIKTPVRGEEPVFIVTGRKEDVEMAKREIVSAAEHFSMIRASRCKAGGSGGGGGGGSLPGPPHLPGQTTIQVRRGASCCHGNHSPPR